MGRFMSYVWLAVIREKTVFGFLALVAVAFSLSLFLGSSAVLEQNAFAVVYLAGSLRLVGALAMILIVSSFIRRLFESREIDFFIALPLRRIDVLMGLAVSFVSMGTLMAMVIALPLMAVMNMPLYGGGLLVWAVSLAVEFSLIGLVAMFFAFVLPGATASALMSVMFYSLCRLTGVLLGILQSNAANTLPGYPVIEFVTKMITILLPRLDLMGQSIWLIRSIDPWESMIMLATQAVAYGALVIAAAAFDLYRRAF